MGLGKVPASLEVEQYLVWLALEGRLNEGTCEEQLWRDIDGSWFFHELQGRCWEIAKGLLEEYGSVDRMVFTAEADAAVDGDAIRDTVLSIYQKCTDIADRTMPPKAWVEKARAIKARREAWELFRDGQDAIQGDDGTNTPTIVEGALLELEAIAEETAEDCLQASDYIYDVMGELQLGGGGRIIGTPWTALNEKFSWQGLKEEFVIMAGRPSMGKSTAMLDWALHVVTEQGKRAAIFSAETSPKAITGNALTVLSGISTHDIRRYNSLPRYQQAILAEKASMISQMPLFIEASWSAADIASKARRLVKRHGVDIVFVDYLQKLEGSSSEEKRMSVARSSNILCRACRNLGVPFVVLAQLSRACEKREDKRPQLSDLRESGEIEQDADVVIMVYRDSYYNGDPSEPGYAEFILRKQREGSLGKAYVWFDGSKLLFSDLDERNRLYGVPRGGGHRQQPQVTEGYNGQTYVEQHRQPQQPQYRVIEGGGGRGRYHGQQSQM